MPTTITAADLRPRELQVVRKILEGKTYEQMAQDMGLGAETIKSYAKRVRAKLNVTSKIQIAMWAVNNNITAEGSADVNAPGKKAVGLGKRSQRV